MVVGLYVPATADFCPSKRKASGVDFLLREGAPPQCLRNAASSIVS